MTTYLPLPKDIQGEMLYRTWENYPTIKIGEYENFFQKIVAYSEKDLFDVIRKIKKYGVKTTGYDNVSGRVWYNTQGIHDQDYGDFCIVQPAYQDTNIDYPHYHIDELDQCQCDYDRKCKYHVEGAIEECPPPIKMYVTYLAFVPKNVLPNL